MQHLTNEEINQVSGATFGLISSLLGSNQLTVGENQLSFLGGLTNLIPLSTTGSTTNLLSPILSIFGPVTSGILTPVSSTSGLSFPCIF